jgi:hypothetical protein
VQYIKIAASLAVIAGLSLVGSQGVKPSINVSHQSGGGAEVSAAQPGSGAVSTGGQAQASHHTAASASLASHEVAVSHTAGATVGTSVQVNQPAPAPEPQPAPQPAPAPQPEEEPGNVVAVHAEVHTSACVGLNPACQ